MSFDSFPLIRLQAGPSNAYTSPGALAKLGDFFSAEELSQALWIGGRRATAAASPYLPEAFHHATERRLLFEGHCTHRLVDQWARLVASGPVIGMGGGSALDTAKAVAAQSGRPFVAIPTIAATCAAWTPLSVWYDDQGAALRFEVFSQGAHLLLAEPAILAAAPHQYLLAGIGDTLAKWFEARVLCWGVNPLPLAAQLGLEVSRVINQTLLRQGDRAVEANQRGEVTPAFVEVVDAVIAGGGVVGGLGERFTRVAAAHAVHNGLTILPELHQVLHGAKVAFGILVQLQLEGRTDERAELVSAYARWGLPRTLTELGVSKYDPRIDAVVEKILVPHESIHALPFAVTPQSLKEALLA